MKVHETIKSHPTKATKGKLYSNVIDMVRDILSDEPEFVADLEARMVRRQLVKSLAVARACAGLSQKELAAKMGCGQAKVSKLEAGEDADLRLRDVIAYLQAIGPEAKVSVTVGGGIAAVAVAEPAGGEATRTSGR